MSAIRVFPVISLVLCAGAMQAIAQQAAPAEMVFPGAEWAERAPAELGVDPEALAAAVEYFHQNGGGAGTDEMAIVRDGYLIWHGPAIDRRHAIYSMTKTFTTTVMGVLAKQGLVHPEDLAMKHWPPIVEGSDGQDAYATVRLHDLATMTAGYQGARTGCWQLHEEQRYEEYYECLKQYLVPGRPEYPPRSQISYRDPNVHILGYVLTRVAGKPLEDVFREHVADKIGVTGWEWTHYGERDGIRFNNPAGTPLNDEATTPDEIQGGIWTTARDLARYGLLYLNRGNWAGEQLLEAEYVDTAISNQVNAALPTRPALAGRYGYYWWTNGVRADGTRPWPSAPPRTATGVGYGGNYCFVIPEWRMVVARTSLLGAEAVPGRSAARNPWDGFFSRLGEGVGE